MQAVGQRIVDGINLRICQQFVIGLMDARDVMFARKFFSSSGVAGCNGNDLYFRHTTCRIRERHGHNRRRAEDADSYGHELNYKMKQAVSPLRRLVRFSKPYLPITFLCVSSNELLRDK